MSRETHEGRLSRVLLGLVQRPFDVGRGGEVRLEVGFERTPALNDDALLDQSLGRSIRYQPRVEAARLILCSWAHPSASPVLCTVRQGAAATVPHARRRLQRVSAPRGYPTVYMRYPPGRRTSASIITWYFVQNARKTT